MDYCWLYWCWLELQLIVIILTCIGTDDHRVKTFLMQHTGSRICYLPLSKWCLAILWPGCCFIFQPVGKFSYITVHISMRAMMRSAQQSLVRVPLNPPPPPPPTHTHTHHLTCLFFYPRSILKILCVDSDWYYLFDFNLIDNIEFGKSWCLTWQWSHVSVFISEKTKTMER